MKFNNEYADQKKSVWMMTALESEDQLRQRVAWALSQILVITPNQIRITGKVFNDRVCNCSMCTCEELTSYDLLRDP